MITGLALLASVAIGGDCDRDLAECKEINDGMLLGMELQEVEALADEFPSGSGPERPSDPPALYYEYRLDPICPGRHAGRVDGNMCDLAKESCDSYRGDGPYMAVVKRVMRTSDNEPQSAWQDHGETCFPEAAPGRSGQVADERIAKAFKVTKFALPVPKWDPPRTDPLVNKPVYFMADFAEAGYESGEIRTIPPGEMLGHELRIMPELKSVTYDFGDGTTKGPTTDKGAEYPDGEITHTYETTDPVQPKITAEYTGKYSLDGGDWRPLGIYVEVESDPTTLTPSELTTELVQPPG